MSRGFQSYKRLLWGAALAALVVGAMPAPAVAQPDNIVTIKIVNNTIKIGNRGVGLCKKDDGEDCKNQIVWQWQGGTVPYGNPKIVISFIHGTEEAFNCFQGASGLPKLTYELLNLGDTVSATVSEDCPAKSAWLYQVSCIRTDEGHEGEECEGIPPVDPGAVIG